MKKNIAMTVVCGTLAGTLALTACKKVSEAPAESGSSAAAFYGYAAEGEFVSPVYAALSEDEKAVYDKIKDAAADFKETVSFDPPVPRDTARRLYRLVYTQERKYFWLSSLFYAPDSEIDVLRLNYLYTREDAELKRAELDMAASTVIGELPDGASDFDKVVFFHDRIVTGCDFNAVSESGTSAYGVLAAGQGQCEGYAAAMALLCDKEGIPNYTVTGTNSDGESHAWNKVLLDGEWYNADCTWDDPIIKRDDPDFVRHDYLLVTDSEIEGKTHFTDELYKGLPACTGEKMNYFAEKGILFGSASEGIENFREQIKAAGMTGKREAEIRFSTEDAYYAAMARLFDSGEIKTVIEDINGNFGTKIRSAYKHNNDSLRIVHISLIYESDPKE